MQAQHALTLPEQLRFIIILFFVIIIVIIIITTIYKSECVANRCYINKIRCHQSQHAMDPESIRLNTVFSFARRSRICYKHLQLLLALKSNYNTRSAIITKIASEGQ